MIKNKNIDPRAAISPDKILGYGGMFGTVDYFHVAPVASAYYEWLRERVPSDRLYTTLALAHVNMTADRGDTALVYPGSYVQSTTALTWSKDQCHIIGVGPTGWLEHEVSLTNGNADATPTTGNFVFSANECSISNLCLRHRGAAANVINASITGDNLRFNNVHFHNMANTATAGATGALGVSLNGCNQPMFNRCVFGGTEIERTASACDMSVGAGTCDNLYFYDCLWIADLDGTADASHAFFKTIANADLAKFAYFENPMFVNAGAAAALPDAMTIHADLAGEIVMRNVMLASITDIADNEEKVWILAHQDTTAGKFAGIGIHPDVT